MSSSTTASSGLEYTVRKACKEDVAEIIRLVQELADYEKMSDGPQLTADDFIRDGGFDGGQSFYQCHVAELANAQDNGSPANGTGEGVVQPPKKLAGFVLYFWTYSTWEGRSVYMEDLYVSPDFRGKGVGKALWKACVGAGLEIGCTRCNFSVLDWNKPSIEFYKRNGAADLTAKDGWLAFRMVKQDMIKFCSN